ncbi:MULTISPECIES: phosphatase PAP2 family protein [unclassified Rhodococcus (in: high G+C Gram-positive bacteria)]|uniref:phosphatase PAP2 family protein n=1 Tax=unclassified Rhodococcus (in: high G+C Gram-positive bacteria) TaxID=192944 RepID=UPI000A7125D3|nr:MULTISPECIES: phosphatase PAP2 family protein [unclassified Rhodococcus (in: high G+C Gram-positive bacteria)]
MAAAPARWPDQAVLDWMVDHRDPVVTDIVTVITTVGNTGGVALATIAVAVWFVTRGARPHALALVVTMLLGWGLMNALKYTFRRDRPPLPERLVDISTFSFPSGHAMMSAMFAAAVVCALARMDLPRKRTRAAAAVVTAASLLIGFSRVYLGAHWLTDVVAGWALGAAFGAAGIVLVLRLISARAGR